MGRSVTGGLGRVVVRSLGGLVAAAVMLVVSAAPAQALEQRLIAADGAAGQFVNSVDVDGDTAVMGVGTIGPGAVYVFTRSGDTWTQTAKLTASDAGASDRLGDSVAIDGDTIVAGAPGDDGLRGAVYTFSRTGSPTRTETAKLTASDTAELGGLGKSVAIDGDTIVAGAWFANANSSGAVYTFARTGAATRTETAKLTAVGSMHIGWSVAIDGDTIVAGENSGSSGSNAGTVYTFARTGAASRSETARLTASDGVLGDDLGWSVAIAGDTIVAGAPADYEVTDTGVRFHGSAYTFARTGASVRTETAKLEASDGRFGPDFGASVAIDGDTILVGAYEAHIGDNLVEGAVYTFARTGAAARTETAKLTASDGEPGDHLGYSVAIDGATIIAAAASDDVGSNVDQGSAVVFYESSAVSYADTVLADAPAGYWRFGEATGTAALDSSGHANTGTYVNGPVLGVPGALAGDTNKAVSLDGVNDFVRVPDSNSLDVGNTFSVEGWIKRSSTAQTHTLMIKGFQVTVMNAVNGNQVWLRKPGVSTIARSSVGVPAGAYHHVVVTKNGSGTNSVKIYIDGVSVGVVYVSAAQVIQDTNSVLVMGDSASNQANYDEFAVYDGVLSDARVAAHYAAGT